MKGCGGFESVVGRACWGTSCHDGRRTVAPPYGRGRDTGRLSTPSVALCQAVLRLLVLFSFFFFFLLLHGRGCPLASLALRVVAMGNLAVAAFRICIRFH